MKRSALKRRLEIFVTDYDRMDRVMINSNLGPQIVNGSALARENRLMIRYLWDVAD